MSTVHPPEGLYRDVFRCAPVAHNPQHPAKDRPLMHVKKSLEGVNVALPKPVEDAASLVLHLRFSLQPFLRRASLEGYTLGDSALRKPIFLVRFPYPYGLTRPRPELYRWLPVEG